MLKICFRNVSLYRHILYAYKRYAYKKKHVAPHFWGIKINGWYVMLFFNRPIVMGGRC